MDFYTNYRKQLGIRIGLAVFVQQLLVVGAGWLLYESNRVSTFIMLIIVSGLSVLGAMLVTYLVSNTSAEPLQKLWQAIQHVAPQGDPVPAPSLDDLRIGRELVANLANHVYQMASVVDDVEKTNAKQVQDIHTNFVANTLPLPLIVIDKNDTVVYTNEFLSNPKVGLGEDIYDTSDGTTTPATKSK